MNPLNRQLFFRSFRRQMKRQLGQEKAALIWSEAGKEYASFSPALKAHNHSARHIQSGLKINVEVVLGILLGIKIWHDCVHHSSTFPLSSPLTQYAAL